MPLIRDRRISNFQSFLDRDFEMMLSMRRSVTDVHRRANSIYSSVRPLKMEYHRATTNVEYLRERSIESRKKLEDYLLRPDIRRLKV
ncbi:Oidioi.mRNA.OKI2018_I69.chr1.g2492.t1.cds [Oikopleura dioica]|uniref:Oidioi.mRNA.OKI2018_I69.chr1.g2492.t1.cds n=1 Tax=Oikopleura dioica TaxID=34765 RepID=A0ABN7ST05_OIKDI|nr:Oidioi.mRNA.OKI2018_I69.chr1.g2492.t1.cds [Oikopleura dioica]